MSPSARRTCNLLSLGLVLAVFLAGGWSRRWIGDDGFINFRIAQNLFDGYGFVFNPGERVEAGTSPLWIGILYLARIVGIPFHITAIWGGLALSMSGMGLAMWGALRVTGTSLRRSWVMPLGALVYGVLPVGWDYVTSALENGLGVAWMGASYFAMSRFLDADSHRPKRLAVGVGVLVGLAPLVRPELALFAIVFLIAGMFAKRHSRRDRVVFVLSSAVLPVVFQIFRMGYFAAVIPNTAIAKSAGSSYWSQGQFYVWNFLGVYWLLVPLVVCAGVVAWLGRDAPRPKRILVWGLPIMGVIYAVFVARLGGGFMHGRLLLPCLFGALLPVMTLGLQPRTRSMPLLAMGSVVVVVWAGICASSLRIPVENEHGIGDERGWYARMSDGDNPTHVDDYSGFEWHRDAVRHRRSVLAADEPIVLIHPAFDRVPAFSLDTTKTPTLGVTDGFAIGIRGVVLGPEIHVVDRGALADPIASRQRIGDRGRPGHEHHLSTQWIAARFGLEHEWDDRRTRAARHAMQCPDLAELLEAVATPLTARRFVRNIGASFRLTRLRFSADPVEAEAELCPP